MLALAGRGGVDVVAALDDGRAMDVWRRAIRAQGGDPDAPLPLPRETHTVVSTRDGVLVRQDALAFGLAAWRLGAGRARKEDAVQHAAGVDLHVKPGDAVRAGQPLWTLTTDEADRIPRALEAIAEGWAIGAASEPVVTGGPLVAEWIRA